MPNLARKNIEKGLHSRIRSLTDKINKLQDRITKSQRGPHDPATYSKLIPELGRLKDARDDLRRRIKQIGRDTNQGATHETNCSPKAL